MHSFLSNFRSLQKNQGESVSSNIPDIQCARPNLMNENQGTNIFSFCASFLSSKPFTVGAFDIRAPCFDVENVTPIIA